MPASSTTREQHLDSSDAVLDHSSYPYIVSKIVDYSDRGTLLAWRRTSHVFLPQAEKHFYHHLTILKLDHQPAHPAIHVFEYRDGSASRLPILDSTVALVDRDDEDVKKGSVKLPRVNDHEDQLRSALRHCRVVDYHSKWQGVDSLAAQFDNLHVVRIHHLQTDCPGVSPGSGFPLCSFNAPTAIVFGAVSHPLASTFKRENPFRAGKVVLHPGPYSFEICTGGHEERTPYYWNGKNDLVLVLSSFCQFADVEDWMESWGCFLNSMFATLCSAGVGPHRPRKVIFVDFVRALQIRHSVEFGVCLNTAASGGLKILNPAYWYASQWAAARPPGQTATGEDATGALQQVNGNGNTRSDGSQPVNDCDSFAHIPEGVDVHIRDEEDDSEPGGTIRYALRMLTNFRKSNQTEFVTRAEYVRTLTKEEAGLEFEPNPELASMGCC
ncbi:hypothetical protein Q8F55_002998 [Vanrija albida]|uniref:Uncharacterized protein n=1 Tax=Vanrija albida TaxID=181172 RepID=A0ABR3QBD1_9TREE